MRRVRHLLEYASVRLVGAVMRVLPMGTVRRCGMVLGRCAYALDRGHRSVALSNLAHAFPDRSAAERRALARAVFAHFGSALVELVRFSGLSRAQMLQLFEIDGEEHVRRAHQQGRGVLLFTGHFGYWEIHAIAHALSLPPMSVLARTLDNPWLQEMLERVRMKTGNAVIYRQGAIRKVMRDLARNRGVAILIDQHMQTSDAVDVEFFKRPAATTSTLAAIAMRTGAPVIPAFALPLPRGRYRLIYERPIAPSPADSPDAIRAFTQRCTDVLEAYVRDHPELWLWMHRRWRDRDPAPADRDLSLDEARVDAT